MSEDQKEGCGFCHYFCPPCFKQITERIVFTPPSPANYELDLIDAERYDFAFLISPEADTTGLKNVLKQRARFVKTSLEIDIAVLYINCNQDKKYTIIYSHGNSVDLGQIHKYMTDISLTLKCDIISYDYSGYGQSEGKPTEENVYADIKAVWDYTLAFHEPRAERIILFGHSLGTVPTIDLASKVQCAGVIVQSPFKSMLGVACPRRRISSCLDRFKK